MQYVGRLTRDRELKPLFRCNVHPLVIGRLTRDRELKLSVDKVHQSL